MPLRPSRAKNNASSTAPAEGAPPAYSPDIDERLTAFWEKYNRPILMACCVVLVVILAKGVWDFFADQHEQSMQKEFAAATTPGAQRSFAAAHPDNLLAGVAQVQIGDAAYAANQMDDAIAAYSRAIDILKTGPLAARAQLGMAVAKIQAGRTAEGEAELRQLLDDTHGYRAVRAEAAYHLASRAAAAGRSTEVQNFSTQLMQIDPNSPWTQRAFALNSH